MKKRFIAGFMVLLVVLCGCGASSRSDSSALGGYVEFWLQTPEVTLNAESETALVKYHLKPTDAEIRWRSTDEAVATVDDTGMVTAVGPGECTVIAEVGMMTKDGQDWDSYVSREAKVFCDFNP